MSFVPLFGLDLKHSYYADSRCADFSIAPAPNTDTLLRNHRCVLKSRADGIRVLITTDERNKPLIPIPKKTAFTFQLQLQNLDFPLFTDLNNFATKSVSKTITYPVKAAIGTTIFATVDIAISALNVIKEPVIHEVNFAAKEVRWIYYFVTDLSAENAVFRLIDTDSELDLFPDSQRTELNQNPDPSDFVAKMLGNQYPDRRRFRFVSGQSISCQQIPRKNLQLRLGDSKIFEHLPNPSYRNSSRIYVNGIDNSKPQEQDAFFQIVKYITNPSLTKV